MSTASYKLRVTVTFTNGAIQTIDCDKMMHARNFKSEVIGMFRESDKPQNPHCKWLPFFIVNMANVASIHRMEMNHASSKEK
jgi:hypothetical protein